MALFRCTVYKRLTALDEPTWTNIYHYEALGVNSALDAAEGAAALEMAVSIQAVVVYRLTAKPVSGGQIGIRSVNIPGAFDVDPVNLVPLFNTIRCIFTDNVERSESKYLRGCIAEANVQGFNISGELRTAVQDDYVTPLLETLGIRGPNGETLQSGTVQQAIQNRQVGWHRRTRPGYKRGWVPV